MKPVQVKKFLPTSHSFIHTAQSWDQRSWGPSRSQRGLRLYGLHRLSTADGQVTGNCSSSSTCLSPPPLPHSARRKHTSKDTGLALKETAPLQGCPWKMLHRQRTPSILLAVMRTLPPSPQRGAPRGRPCYLRLYLYTNNKCREHGPGQLN